MASEFITRVERDKDEPYTVIFRTDDADKYKHIEDECRKMIGHAKPTEQPTVDAVPVEWIESYVKWLRKREIQFAPVAIETMLSYYKDLQAYCDSCGERKNE